MADKKVVYRSIDSIIIEDPKDMFNIPTEFLSRMTPSGFPPHELQLKIGCIVKLLRNLDLKEGLCNRTGLTSCGWVIEYLAAPLPVVHEKDAMS
ncbi:hypothetical protein ANCDUO_07446 [Ancylostoma duodenale]|uniref:DNA helicase Pif1-like 2B domain-containing protein n=1 Tax=Ancylostoma duodenale TaxID=51022 RepID=A0A0C2DIH0_9BILA|nr:hypothetical protein ANCDUO_07446 [Ancylostoma duodenale]